MLVSLDASGQTGGISAYEIRVSSETYGLTTVKKAAYRFTGRCSFDFRLEGKEIICNLLFSQPQSTEALASIELAFRNELLDQDLRARIAEETTSLRNAVLAFAFSKTGIQSTDEI